MDIIAFTGMPFSGKSEAVEIAKEMNIPVIRMGDMVWDEVKKHGLELNDKNVGMIASEMRRQFGKDIWAKKTIEKLNSMKIDKFLVIDGIRNFEEVETFKTKLGKNFSVVAVQVSDETRYKRAMSRNRIDDSKDLEKIKERDRRERSWGITQVIASADIVISNEGNLSDFRKNIRKILSEHKQ